MAKEYFDKPIKLAFLGCGFATRLHSKTLSHFQNDVCCLYASRSVDKAMAYNRRFRGSGFFDSYESAISSDGVDVVLIATPPSYHLDLTLRALRHGKDVIVEKPPFLRASDFDIIQSVQAETNRLVFVAENYFYKPVAVRLREIIGSGIIGEVLFLHLNAVKTQKTRGWRDSVELSGGGALFEGGIHWINFIANLGLSVKAVRGFRPGDSRNLERSMLVVVEYAEGAIGTLYYSWEVPSPLKGLRVSRIFGREGSITFESSGLFIFVYGSKKRVIIPNVTDISGSKTMFQDFILGLRTRGEPHMTLARARRDLELLESVYSSLDRQP